MSENAESLVPAIYAAAMEPGQWPALIGRVGELFGAQSSFLFTSHSETNPDALHLTHNLDPQMAADFNSTWHSEDPFALAAARRGCMTRNTVVVGVELVPREVLLRTPYYNEYSRGYGMEALLGAVLFDETEGLGIPFTNLCWYREPGQPEFQLEDKRLLRGLLPHFQQALELQHRMHGLRTEGALATHGTNALGTASLLLDGQGRVLQANAAGQALIDNHPNLLRFAGGRLRGLGLRCAPTFEEAFRACRNGIPLRLLVQWQSPGTLIYATLVALPLETQTHVGGFEQERFLLLLELPRDDAAFVVDRAGELFGLTPAEQRVVLRLLDGMAAEDIAQALGISLNTVRTQVRSVLAKTGLTRQVDLVRLLSRLRG